MKYMFFGILTLAALPALADIKMDILSDKVDRLDRENSTVCKRQQHLMPASTASDAVGKSIVCHAPAIRQNG